MRNDCFIWSEDHLCSLRVQVKCSENQDKSTEGRKALNSGIEPVIKQVEQKHLGLCCFQDSVSELLDLQTSLERKLELTSLDDDVREIE